MKAAMDALREQVRVSSQISDKLRAELTQAEEQFVQELAARDQDYARQISIFRSQVQDIASTPEGAAALARFNAGDEIGALSVLDRLNAAADTAQRLQRAARYRRTAGLALQVGKKGKLTIAAVIARYEAVTALDPGVHWDWVQLAALYRESGRIAEGRQAAQRAKETAQDDHDRVNAELMISDFLVREYETPGAVRVLQRAADIARSLAERDPSNPNWKRDVAVVHNRRGDLLLSSGDTSGALSAYSTALRSMKELAEADPEDADGQRDLYIAYGKVGRALTEHRNYVDAMNAFQHSIRTIERLSERDPSNLQWQADRAESYSSLANLLSSKGDRRGAVDMYERAQQTIRDLVEKDPTNLTWRSNLAVSQRAVGSELLTQGDAAGALAAFRSLVVVAEKLATEHPDDVVLQTRLLDSYRAVAIALERLGDGNGALQAYLKTLNISERHLRLHPSNVTYQSNAVDVYLRIADFLLSRPNGNGTLAAYRRARELADAFTYVGNAHDLVSVLATSKPGDAGAQHLVSVVSLKKGGLQLARGDTKAALETLRDAVAQAEAFVTRNGSNYEWRRHLALCYGTLGDAEKASGEGALALQHYTKALDVFKALSALDPANAGTRRNMVNSLVRLNELTGERGYLLQALEIVTDLQRRGALNLQDVWIVNDVMRRAGQ